MAPCLNTYAADFESGNSQQFGIADASQTGLTFTTTFTFETWVKYESLLADGERRVFIAQKQATVDVAYGFTIANIGGQYRLTAEVCGIADESSRDQYYVVVTPSVDQWYHYAVTCDVGNPSATTFEFFVDGVSQGNGTGDFTNNIAAIVNSSSAILVGAQKDALGFVVNFWDGRLDDVRMWNDVRTSTEIATNRARELAGNEAGLVAYWKFDNDALDSTSNNNDLNSSVSPPTFSTDVAFCDGTTTSTSTSSSTSTTTSTSTSTTTTTTSTSTTTTTTSTTTTTTSTSSSTTTSTSTTQSLTTSTSTSSSTSTSTTTTTTIPLPFYVENIKQ